MPSELAGLVLLHLPAHTNHIRFSAVCRHWRISARQHRLPPPLPWFILPGCTFFSLPHSESFQIRNGAQFHSSCSEWLVFSSDDTCSLVNTFSKVTLTLPDVYFFDPIIEPVGVISGHSIPYTLLNPNVVMSISKVILCSELLVAAIVDVWDLHTLALCRPGGNLWFVSALGYDRYLKDIILHEDKLYTVDGWRNLYVIYVGEDTESGKLIMSRIERVIKGPPWPFRSSKDDIYSSTVHLVESCGALLLVRGTIFGKSSWEDTMSDIKTVQIEFEVFEANLQSSQWVEMRSVGDDKVLFLGPTCSQSVCGTVQFKGELYLLPG